MFSYRTVDARGHVTESTYDSAGQVVATTTNLGTAEQQSTQVAYTFDGRALTRTDTLGNVSSSRYDRAGRLVQAIHADGTTSETVYDGAGRAYLTTDRHVAGQAARASRTLYDAAGRSVGSQRLDGVLVTVAADNPTAVEAGRTYSASVANAGTVVSSTQTHYDAFGRVDYTVGADQQRTDTTYDAAGRPTTLMPEAFDAETGTRRRASSSSTYDGLGRVLTSTDARGRFECKLRRIWQRDGVDGAATLGGEFGFHGGWRDASIALLDIHARSDLPTTGRFISGTRGPKYRDYALPQRMPQAGRSSTCMNVHTVSRRRKGDTTQRRT